MKKKKINLKIDREKEDARGGGEREREGKGKIEKWLQRKTSHHPPERRIHEKSSMEEICMRVKYKLAEYPRV